MFMLILEKVRKRLEVILLQPRETVLRRRKTVSRKEAGAIRAGDDIAVGLHIEGCQMVSNRVAASS
jgi:hypothetical protein